jgi:hypothetical protein
MSDCSTLCARDSFEALNMSGLSNPEPTTAPSPGTAITPARHQLLRVSVRLFLGALVALFVVAPFLEQMRNGELVEAVLMTLVLTTGVLTVSSGRLTMALAILLVLPALVGKWLNHFWPDQVPPGLFLVAAVIFVSFVISRLLAYILRAPAVNNEVLCAGISAYLMLGLAWALAYMVVGQLVPDAFSFSGPAHAAHSMLGFTAFYFSFITLTTVGYGDIIPVAPAARMLAIMEAMTGTLFVGMLIARLVSLYSSAPKPGSSALPERRV